MKVTRTTGAKGGAVWESLEEHLVGHSTVVLKADSIGLVFELDLMRALPPRTKERRNTCVSRCAEHAPNMTRLSAFTHKSSKFADEQGLWTQQTDSLTEAHGGW